MRSLRGEWLLFGIRDFELITLAREAAQANPAVAEALDHGFARVVRAALTAFANPVDADPRNPLFS